MSSAASRMCDLMKACRSKWLTRPELMAELGISRNAVQAWTDEMTSQGFLVSRERDRSLVSSGYPPMEFALSVQWGGTADV